MSIGFSNSVYGLGTLWGSNPFPSDRRPATGTTVDAGVRTEAAQSTASPRNTPTDRMPVASGPERVDARAQAGGALQAELGQPNGLQVARIAPATEPILVYGSSGAAVWVASQIL